jgi:hypothetical protein
LETPQIEAPQTETPPTMAPRTVPQESAGAGAPLSQPIERHISWGELGCPKEIGRYAFSGMTIRVMRVHILAAENDPGALFTVCTRHPPYGPPEHMLGHRVA